MKKEIKIYLEETEKYDRQLWIDDGEKKMRLWALGFGVPVSIKITTPDEDEISVKERVDRERKEDYESAKRRHEKELRPWYKKIFN